MDKILIAACNTKPIADCLTLEWLDTNALGGYSSSTILNCHTRKYHGLLVSKLTQPFGHFVLLSKLEDTLTVGIDTFPLSTTQYLGAMEQGGYPYLESFEQDNHISTFNYSCDSCTLRKQILLVKHKNTLLVKYTLAKKNNNSSVKISINPFIAYRDINCLTKQNAEMNQTAECFAQGIVLTPYRGMPTLKIYSKQNFSYCAKPYWYNNFAYIEEKLRGYAYTEDLFTPGIIELSFDENNEIILACSIESIIETDLHTLWQQESISRIPAGNIRTAALCAKSQQLITCLPNNIFSIKAGYHWFGEWGRDAMISLPGLTLCQNQEDIALSVLKHFASNEHLGIIPNRISPNNPEENEYDNVDGSMWFIWAIQQFYLKTQDSKTIQQLFWSTIKNIIYRYQNGTLFNIHQLPNGLIYAGTPLVKTTWMDVKINNIPLTPRNGMQVEVNGLWYNALCFTHELARLFKDPIANTLAPLIALVEKNYSAIFWDSTLNYLYDFVNENEANSQLRPNQIIAAGLPYSPLDKTIIAEIVAVVTKQLLTPYGLRSLAADDPNYHGMYFGDQIARDTAYHNGTVWPWLLGFYTEALLKVKSQQETLALLQPCINTLHQHFLTEAGLGCISEIFDGSAPHHARGCIQQAWSIAELIRLTDLLTA